MGSTDTTEPHVLVHPRAAVVAVLSVDACVEVSELTLGTLHLTWADTGVGPFAHLTLRVDGTFVPVEFPRVLGLDGLVEGLRAALRPSHLVVAHPSTTSVVLSVTRADEVEAAPRLFCTSFDASLRVRKVAHNRLVLKGLARGSAEVRVRVDEALIVLQTCAGQTPLSLSQELRRALDATHACLLSMPAESDGDVVLTVLPRR